MTNHGCVCSCVGPIIDAQMRSNLFYKEKFMIIEMRTVLSMRDVFLPSVYDVLLVIRPSCNFRDGRVIKNYTANFRQYFIELPFNDGYLFSLVHLMPANYRSTLHWLCNSMCNELCDFKLDIILGFASLFLLIKSYASCLVGELSQLCYKGVLRTIALGSTDALCTWRCLSLIGLQPVIVPVGRIALGRIFNVLGSIIDRYIPLCNSCQFNKSILVEILQHLTYGLIFVLIPGSLVESNLLDLTYALTYPNHLFTIQSHNLTKLYDLVQLWNTLIINTILKSILDSTKGQWIIYIV
jgi:hypothetical protein